MLKNIMAEKDKIMEIKNMAYWKAKNNAPLKQYEIGGVTGDIEPFESEFMSPASDQNKQGGKAKVIGSLIEAGSQMIPGTGSKEAEIATSKADVLLGAHNRGKL